MFNSKELVIRFKEDSIDVAVLRRSVKDITIEQVSSFSANQEYNAQHVSFNTELYTNEIKGFLDKNKIKSKKVRVVLALDGIITRQVETPYLPKGELEKFLRNNIEQYFTVNITDYYYDYKIVDVDKSGIKKFVVLLVVVPKVKIKELSSFLSSCGLKPSLITIYPECIANIFTSMKDHSIAVFDIGSGKSSITILERGGLFLYSSIAFDIQGIADESYYEEVLDNMGYFLNFYATRHFGNMVDKIFLVGELRNDKKFFNIVKEQFEIETSAGVDTETTRILNEENLDKNEHCDIIGIALRSRSYYNKSIDFSKISDSERGIDILKGFSPIIAILVSITLLWISVSIAYVIYTSKQLKIDRLDVQIAALKPAEIEQAELIKQKADFEQKAAFLKKVKGEEYNYMAYLDAFKQGLPNNVTIKSIVLNKEMVGLIVNINNSTLDKVKLVIAINNMDIFEKLEIDSIKLDDSEKEANLVLKIKKPL